MTLGETAGRYRIVGRIAAGGMGEVYRAAMETVGGVEKTVALKVVKSQLARDGEFAALFVEEAKVAMTLSHANVVHAFDVGRIDDRWYLAMEHVDGVNLAELLRACEERLGQPIPHRYVLFVVIEALKGLDYAHRRRGPDSEPLHIVHRDVSPGNLLVSYEGEVKVADFGIAKSTLRSFGSMAGTVKGKIPYMAPEQLRGAAVDRRADVYSVGAVLYELLTGRRVVEEDEPTQAIPQVLSGEITRPRTIAASVSEELDAIVMRALAPAPEDRFPSAAAMRQELERLAMREGYLLSSGDLADFVQEVMERDEAAPARPSRASTTPGRATAQEVETAEAEPARDADGDPFDALLGMQLEKVQTGEPFSVFTSGAAGRRLATAPRRSDPRPRTPPGRDDAGPTTPPAVETGTLPGFPSRRRKRTATVIFGGVVAAVLAAAGVYGAASQMGGGPSARSGRPAEAAAPDVPATGQEPAPSEEPELPRGRETPGALEARAGTDAGVAVADPVSTRAPRPRERPVARQRPARPSGSEVAETPGPPSEGAPPATGAAEPALLSVNTDPWSYVYVDGTRLGPTPQLSKRLAPGRHQIRLHNPSEDLERSVVVELSAGEHRRITMDLRP